VPLHLPSTQPPEPDESAAVLVCRRGAAALPLDDGGGADADQASERRLAQGEPRAQRPDEARRQSSVLELGLRSRWAPRLDGARPHEARSGVAGQSHVLAHLSQDLTEPPELAPKWRSHSPHFTARPARDGLPDRHLDLGHAHPLR